MTTSEIEQGQRPRRRRKEARPAELIEAGLQEFALRGFAVTRMEDIAKRAGVAKGTIYRYFTDKEALFLAAMRARMGPVFEQIEAFIAGFPGTTRELLTLVFRMAHEQLVNSNLRVLMRVIIAEGENFPALTEHYYTESVAKGRALMGRIIARGVARGEVRQGAAADLPLVIMAPAIMAAVWRMTFDKHAPIPAEAFLAAHLDLVFDGVLKR
jgi:AcrR family transcriptional regulator